MIRRIAKVIRAAPLSVLLLAVAGCPAESGSGRNFIVIEETVFATHIDGGQVPALPINPVAGAVVSTSLSARTATTDASGHFLLNTGFDDHQCSTYTVRVTATGQPTDEKRWTGGGPRKALFQFILSAGCPLESESSTCVKG